MLGAETLLLVLLLILVAALLRSHAEILRRLGPPAESGPAPATAPVPGRASAPLRSRAGVAPPITGTTLSGDPVRLVFDGDVAQPTLLAFLSGGCASCRPFWAGLGRSRLPGGVEPVVVVRGPDRERPGPLRELAPAGVPVLVSSQAWSDYEVPGSPYFVLVQQRVLGEGVATTFEGLAGMLGDALADAAAPPSAGGDRIDERLAAAGILPGNSSLYPGRSAGR
jgi:hypothetical protein